MEVMKSKSYRQLWLQSVLFSDTLLARDKTTRFLQYLCRALFGLTDRQLFGDSLKVFALARKVLRFYKPVKQVKKIEDAVKDSDLDGTDKALTVVELASDGVYAAIDHITFAQRVGGLKWMSPEQVDLLDRVLEFFWFTETVPIIWREARKLSKLDLRIQSQAGERDEKALADARRGSAARENLARLREARRRAQLLLLKALCCDLPCTFYFMMPLTFKVKRVNKTWCGVLGMIASLISIHMNWPHDRCKDE